MVSAVRSENENSNVLATFTFEGETYLVCKAKGHKCPRCWQFISANANEPCVRCAGVLADSKVES